MRRCLFLAGIFCFALTSFSQERPAVIWVDADKGWAKNSVNTVVFRKNSLVSYKDTQYIAFYNEAQFVVIGKRRSGTRQWLLKQTPFKGRATDAHNSISIMVDGDGYLHMTWDHHNNPLNYAKSKTPGSLELAEKTGMTGLNEMNVTYPEFYKMPGGDVLFLYRDGRSGKGNLVVNRYDVKQKKWAQLQSNLIDGEGQRNAYWQACVDDKGIIHLSWVWRESPDVASNHDLCYARSEDGGRTWRSSSGKKYALPVTASTAEYAARVPENSELINQTSMYAGASGLPYIVSYWREQNDSVPQYRLVYKKGKRWQTCNLGFRKTAFSLKGGGTKRIPISRPQVISWRAGGPVHVAVIFRDAERGNKISMAVCGDLKKGRWKLVDLWDGPVGSWEPSLDTELWREKKILNLFVQPTEQADGEGMTDSPPQMVSVLEWKP